MRVAGEGEIYADNAEIHSEKDPNESETLNCESIPDEVNSLKEIYHEDVCQQSTESQLFQRKSDNKSANKRSTIELSKKCDSVDLTSIFWSDSISSQSHSKAFASKKDYVEVCRELNDMATDYIKQAIQLQESELEEGEEDWEESKLTSERGHKIKILYQEALSYLNAWLKHITEQSQQFEVAFVITIHYNLAWVYQKFEDLKKCSKHLNEALGCIENIQCSNLCAELYKLKYLTKFHLQQWAIKSQLNDHTEALEHGKLSVRNWHSLIFKSYKVLRSRLEAEAAQKHQSRLRVSYKDDVSEFDSSKLEYGAKKIVCKRKSIKAGFAKYMKTQEDSAQSGRKRRCMSEENSKDGSINLSAK